MKLLRFTLLSMFLALVLSLQLLPVYGAVDVTDTSATYDFTVFEGLESGDALPYGKGRNGDCFFPSHNSSSIVFPEVYTWSKDVTLTLTGEGTVIKHSKHGASMMTELDGAPAVIRENAPGKNALSIIIKSGAKASKRPLSIVSLGNKFKKTVYVDFTGEFQEILIDLDSSSGWTIKNAEGKYVPYTEGSPWKTRSMDVGGIRIDYPSLGENVETVYTLKSVSYISTDEKINEVTESNGVFEHTAYINGYPDGTFRPTATITRAEAVSVIARLLDMESANFPKTTAYKDVANDAWYFNAVAFMESNGLLYAFDASAGFNASTPITRAEYVSLLPINEAETKEFSFSDTPETHRLYKAISSAYSVGCINGYPDNTFRPDNTITRAEAVKVANTYFNRKIERETFDIANVSRFSDVDNTYWAFDEIYEAAVSHTAVIADDGTESWAKVHETIDTTSTASKIKEIDERADKMRNDIRSTVTDVVVFGTEYYVSADGDDTADGKSPETAWKTLSKVSNAALSEGDVVYFRRGDVFRGQLVSKTGVTYSAYGEGEKPRLYRSPENGAGEEKWSLVEGTENIWKFYKAMPDCGLIVFNDGESHGYKMTPSYVDGNFVDAYDRKTVVDPKVYLENDLEYVNLANSIMSGNVPKVGSSACTGELYLRCEKGNPGKVFTDIEFNIPEHVIANGGSNYTTYDNLCVKYGGFHGIGSGTCKGLTVTNCEFGWIGGGSMHYETDGSFGRYGNAIEIYGGCEGFVVDNCYIYQAYDCGPTHQLAAGGTQSLLMNDVIYSNNLIEYCTYSIEYFLGKPSVSDEEAYRMQNNILIENNVCRYAGFGFGEQRPDTGTAAHIKGWDHYNPAQSFIIKNNVFDRSRHMMIHCGAGKKEWLPSFSDNVWIQTVGGTGTLGRYGVNPTANLPFDDTARISMIKGEIESNPEIYFAEKDFLYDLPIG